MGAKATGSQECDIYRAHQENSAYRLVTNLTESWPFILSVSIFWELSPKVAKIEEKFIESKANPEHKSGKTWHSFLAVHIYIFALCACSLRWVKLLTDFFTGTIKAMLLLVSTKNCNLWEGPIIWACTKPPFYFDKIVYTMLCFMQTLIAGHSDILAFSLWKVVLGKTPTVEQFDW